MNNIDHLVYVCDHLERGIQQINDLLGVAPVISGKHLAWGTHNALLALGSECYFEVIAPDPEQKLEATIFNFQAYTEPKLLTWGYRPNDIYTTHQIGHAHNWPFGNILTGSRSKPDGSSLSWEITDLNTVLFDGILPFLIHWNQSIHPAPSLPQGCRLHSLRAEHPQIGELQSALATLDIDLAISYGETPQLIATIESPKGLVEIR